MVKTKFKKAVSLVLAAVMSLSLGKSYISSKPERRSCKKYNDFKSWGRIGKTRKKSVIDRCGSTGKFNCKSSFIFNGIVI